MLQATDLLLAQGATPREVVDDSSFQGLRRERLGEQYAQKGLPATNLGRRRAKSTVDIVVTLPESVTPRVRSQAPPKDPLSTRIAAEVASAAKDPMCVRRWS